MDSSKNLWKIQPKDMFILVQKFNHSSLNFFEDNSYLMSKMSFWGKELGTYWDIFALLFMYHHLDFEGF